MPTIKNAELVIGTDRPADRANVVVTCDDVEVNAIDCSSSMTASPAR
jgi:hypothetical protein